MKEKTGILGNLIGTANLSIFFDTASLIRAGVLVLLSGTLLIIIKKLIDKIL
jgi:hypothetical protein